MYNLRRQGVVVLTISVAVVDQGRSLVLSRVDPCKLFLRTLATTDDDLPILPTLQPRPFPRRQINVQQRCQHPDALSKTFLSRS